MVLPAGFGLPPFPHLLVLTLGLGFVFGAIWRTQPPLTQRTVLGFIPWMLTGAAFHALHQLEIGPATLLPFFGTPAAYLTTAIIAGGIWLASDHLAAEYKPNGVLAGTGIGMALVLFAVITQTASTPQFLWPALGVILSGMFTAIVWMGVRTFAPEAATTTSWVGVAVIFAHTLDGVSTAIGIDILGFGERSPAALAILNFAASLPTAEYIGAGWLFLLVKIALASAIVVWFAEFVEESPTQAYLLLTIIIAVGIGPGTHNLLLYVAA